MTTTTTTMHLTTTMNVDLIRDEIMYWLTPMNALNLRLT